MNPETLLKQLIEIESESGNEGPIGSFLFSLLQKYFEVEKIYISEKRFNLIAKTGTPKIYLNTHMDTVPIGNCKIFEDDKRIYGRGTCDSKGSMSAMICAAINQQKNGKTNFGLFFNVGEEKDFAGIKKGLPEKNPPFVVIGEPTELKPYIGQKGLLGFTVIAKGKKAHGATPERGVSAIKKIADAVISLNKIEFPIDSFLGKSSLNIGIINGGTSINTVPDNAQINVEIRTVKSNEIYKQILQKEFKDFEITYQADFDSKITKSQKFIECVEKITGARSKIKKTFTELYFWPIGVIVGPGSTKQAHAEIEFVKKQELVKAAKLYEDFITHFIIKKTSTSF